MRSPRDEDIYVGQRVRQRRLFLGLSQSALASQAGIKFQQVQKYETGANRISASRLCDLARTLKVDPGYFFEGVMEKQPPKTLDGKQEASLLKHFRDSPAGVQDAVWKLVGKQASADPSHAAKVIHLKE